MAGDEPIDIPSARAILERSEDREALERAATALVAARDPSALEHLGDLLTRSELLARLDALDVPSLKTRHLGRVIAALQQHPSARAVELCLNLAADATFLSDPDRLTFLLQALAAVRPMSDETAALFRDANAGGYFSLDANLLARNGSPRALALLGEMLADRAVPADRRVEATHFTVYPYRAEPAMLDLVGGLLAGDLDDEEAIALVRSVFDERPHAWFEPATTPPPPVAWEALPTPTLERVLTLAAVAVARSGLTDELQQAVAHTADRVRAALARRER